jgi:hypothetical protein
MTLITLIILGLATWRLSNMFVVDGEHEPENGPFDILVKIRLLSGIRYDEWSKPYGTNTLSKAMTCVWCFSVWVGAGIAIAWTVCPLPTMILCLPFALSAFAIIANRYING